MMNEEIRNTVREYGISNLVNAYYEMLDETVTRISGEKCEDYDGLDLELLWGEKNWNDIAVMVIAKTRWNDAFDKQYLLTRDQMKNIITLASDIEELAIGKRRCKS